MTPVETATARLVEAIAELRTRRSAFRAHASHLVPDLVLLGFVKHLADQADCVLTLTRNGQALSSFPNARAAFEAGQHALLLVTADDYDLAGARAWVYYARSDFNAVDESEERYGQLPVEDEADRATLERALAEMGSVWEDFSPDKGSLIKDAEALIPTTRQRPDNWAGVPIALELQRRVVKLTAQIPGASRFEDIAGMYNGTYAMLSREAHPRNTVKPDWIKGRPNGPVEFVMPADDPRDETNPVLITVGAVMHGVVALMGRSRLPDA